MAEAAQKKNAKDPKENEQQEGAEGAEAAEGEGKKKVTGKKLILLLLLLLLLLGGGGAGLYFSGILGGGEEAATEGEHAEGEAAEGEHGEGEEGAPKPPEVVFYALPEFLVNLNTGSSRTSFLKMTVMLELAKATDEERVKMLEPKIVDSFTTYLRDLRSSDLSGSAGIYRLREELLLRVNKIVTPAQVNDILFKEMIVQ